MKKAFFFYVITADSLAGTEMYIYNLAKRIKEDGNDVYFITYRIETILLSKLKEVFFDNIFILNEYINCFKSSRREISIIKKIVNKYDRENIILLGANPNGFQFINRLFLGCKIILQIHGSLDKNVAHGRYHLMVAKNANQNLIFDRFGLISPFNLDAYRKEIAIDNAIITQNGFYLKNTKTSADKKIIFLGRVEAPEKNFAELAQIFKKFLKYHPEYSLHVYGEFSSSNPYLLEPNFHFYGSVVDTSIAYKDASLLMMTSISEGMPRVIIEAYDYGVPVIIYDAYLSAKEIVASGISGELVPFGNQKEFIDKMIKILHNWESYSVGAMAESERYNIDFVVKTLYENLDNISKNFNDDLKRYNQYQLMQKIKRTLKNNRVVRIILYIFSGSIELLRRNILGV